ncbi:putative Chitinase 1 precursor [Tripterygium wilfordii]|uniref:Putative Chitinase 1 n=1 Tax=Tripterygium wilfordii TaxID=458696 RepID=A0A7J7DF18_TRIWF|nr:chitinase 2-like [Tripterygium wilfordii]KAF5744666.1 putative Chitinase 1 precursor [Tripterygium wilfordii]
MEASTELFIVLAIVFQAFFLSHTPADGKVFTDLTLFREYIGAEFKNVRFDDVPINPKVDEFHFILSFAIDVATGKSASPTNGIFNVFWDTDNLSPSEVVAIKGNNSNVRVAVSLGGDSSENGGHVKFTATSIDSWVSNAVSSLTKIIKQFNLDGIDIDYEHFDSDPDTFAECIGQLISKLKNDSVISFASIAPFSSDKDVEDHYLALWRKFCPELIDFVNFQFYAEDISRVTQFVHRFEEQTRNFRGGKVLASFITDGTRGGLSPADGFFMACERLKRRKLFSGIFVWSADDSKAKRFKYENFAQKFLVGDTQELVQAGFL